MIEFAPLIADTLKIRTQQVNTVLTLLAEGATIPFIARYRKDKTGALDEVVIQQIQDESKSMKVFAAASPLGVICRGARAAKSFLAL